MLLCCGVAGATPLRESTIAAGPETYTRAVIVAPGDDAAVRSNAGSLTVLTRVDPRLQEGHRLQLLLDGVPRGTAGRRPEFHLENLDRGTHSLQIRIIGDGDRVLYTGPPSVFHLLRHSRLHP